jgi:hypothetical protein
LCKCTVWDRGPLPTSTRQTTRESSRALRPRHVRDGCTASGASANAWWDRYMHGPLSRRREL